MSTEKSDSLFANQIFNDLIDLPSNWEVSISRDTLGNWKAKASVWIDNGYGGRKQDHEVSSDSLLCAIKDLLKETKEITKVCGHRFH